MTGYPLDQLFEEVAYLAYYFHWPHDQIMGMEHRDRVQWIAEITRINRSINESAQEDPKPSW
jgi:hypothetical protein